MTVLRVLCNYGIRVERLTVNPCAELALPSGGESRDRIASPSEALNLVQALPRASDRALWATAFLGGLRRGELMGLRWEDVDLVAQTIKVHPTRGNYDPTSHEFVAPKSKKGARTIGLPSLLVPFLAALDGTEGLVFPGARGGEGPFSDSAVVARAQKAWKAASLQPIGLHEARHTYASVMIAASVNVKTISEWMGHSSTSITLDRYGHLLPGSAAEALGLLDDFLTRELAA